MRSTTALAIPSVHRIREALEKIPGAIRSEPVPEDHAGGSDPGNPIHYFDPQYDWSASAPIAREGAPTDDAENTADHPAVIFEVPPKLTDADVRSALGDNLDRIMQLVQLEGVDALGWYVTFHQRVAQYGVFLPIEGVLTLAVSALPDLMLPPERKLEIAFHAIHRHELFHFETDCMAANWELALGDEVYWWAKAAGLGELEEALANAYMLRGLRHPGGALKDSRGCYNALKSFCALQPDGYRDGPRYARSRVDYIDGCRTLSLDFERARYKTTEDWEIPDDALDSLIFYPNPVRIDWRRCPIVVHDKFGLLRTLDIGVDFFETIVGIVESHSFLRELRKLGRSVVGLWERRKSDLARSVGLNSLGFERWKPGGPDCYSVRLDGNYRVHLRLVRAEKLWVAEAVGDHKAMGHG